MTKEEILTGIAQGRVLKQDENVMPHERRLVDELIASGQIALLQDWTYGRMRDGFDGLIRSMGKPPDAPILDAPGTITLHPSDYQRS